ncbi:MAG: hypothetical protein PWP28_404 [Oceanotoga sp.]|uniref:formylglycine-generating enzyme family protein n=1 Tax=Oceanotoga sp. TaxID=2108366 RepID=UPI00264EE6CD|nr:SUMF1/EgtB/PvdO family nonheme iron enzyme [Oceanotoga sp.]MDN5341529.1 hypothetical protein [Oceanotoga sp.]
MINKNKVNEDNNILLEKGSFIMVNDNKDYYEKSAQKVTLTYDYYIAKHETTFEEYYEYCEDTNKNKPKDLGWKRGKKSVIYVSWWDAIKYCNWKSKKNGISIAYDSKGNLLDKNSKITTELSKVEGYRLPSEAEWEYAARGGQKSNSYKYSGSNLAKEVTWYSKNSKFKTHEIGKKLPNELGLYDMSGNVWEWCYDWYTDYNKSNQIDPLHHSLGKYRVVRGGSWFVNSHNVRIVNRYNNLPNATVSDVGFRLVKTLIKNK